MIYVDELKAQTPTSAQVARAGLPHGHLWCHMMADSEEDLHRFAALIGMKRNWYHVDHYDLTPPRRLEAVRLGALQVSTRFLIGLRQKARALVPFES